MCNNLVAFGLDIVLWWSFALLYQGWLCCTYGPSRPPLGLRAPRPRCLHLPAGSPSVWKRP